MATQHDVVQVSDLANHCAGELGSGELGSGELGSGELGSGAARFCGSSVLLVLCYTIHFRHAHNLDDTMSR